MALVSLLSNTMQVVNLSGTASIGNTVTTEVVTAKLSTGITIPEGDSPVTIFPIPSDLLPVGASEITSLGGVVGTLINNAGVYQFTRTFDGAATVVPSGQPIVFTASFVSPDETKGDDLAIEDGKIFLGDGERISFEVEQYDSLNLETGGAVIDGTHLKEIWSGDDDSLAMAITNKGHLFFGEEEVRRNLGFNDYGLLEYWTDENGRLLFGYDVNGNIVRGNPALQSVSTIEQIMIVGQSLSVGSNGIPVLSSEPDSSHLTFSSGGVWQSESGNTQVLDESAITSSGFKPLLEEGRETIASSFAKGCTSLGIENSLLLASTGVGGQRLDQVSKTAASGTTLYENTIKIVSAAQDIAANNNRELLFGAVFLIQGEADLAQNTPKQSYIDELQKFILDLLSDIQQERTSGSLRFKLFYCQTSSHTAYNRTTSEILQAQYEIDGLDENAILVCPKYFLPYADGIHLTNIGYQWLGDYYSKAYMFSREGEASWECLKHESITINNNIVRIKFRVKNRPLVLDTTLVSDPSNFGFEWEDDSGATISSVALDGLAGLEDEVVITLSGNPTTNKTLRYAYTGVSGNDAGPSTGARGCLRDSDPTILYSGNPLHNYCVAFSVEI